MKQKKIKKPTPIAKAFSKVRIKRELHAHQPLLEASHGGFQLYLLDGCEIPETMNEIGRLREEAYRSNGAGTGQALDIDQFDVEPQRKFKQLILWDPAMHCIAGGYRLLVGSDALFDKEGQPEIPSAHMFHFSEEFIRDYLPQTIELSRSYISQPFLRKAPNVRNIFALDSLLEGISAATGKYGMRYFIGKVTFYPDFPKEAFDMVAAFFTKHAASDLVIPHEPVETKVTEEAKAILCHDDFRQDFRALKLALRARQISLPPILNTYINICSRFRYFGTAVYKEFGGALEMGLLVDTQDIIIDRYLTLLNPA